MWMLPAFLLLSHPLRAATHYPHFFELEQQALSRALILFSHQAEMAIVFEDDVARGLESPALQGEMSAHKGLKLLLDGTDLGFEIIDSSIIAIFREGCERSNNCPGPQELLVMRPLYIPGVEEVFVFGRQITGSRIRRGHFQGTAPVEVVSAPEIEFSGAQTVADVLRYLPAVSGNSTSTSISNGGDGTATVTLRGLPASNTLVLINGHRTANDGLAGESVDLNSIPPSAIERIEILKDGASAIYGSDAIAGVVNIILKQDYRGAQAQTFYGSTTRDDLQTQTHSFQFGTNFRRGSAFFVASQFDQGSINSRDRGVSASADSRLQGGADLRSSATPAARVTLPTGGVVIPGSVSGSFREATDEDLFDFAPYTTAVVPSSRDSAFGSISYDFSKRFSGTLEASYVKNRARAQLAPTPIFTAFEQIPLTVSADNVFNPFGADITDVRRRVLELPPRSQVNESRSRRISLNLQGSFSDWDWDLGYNWSKNDARETLRGLINASNLQLGLGGDTQCREAGDCVPINLFGPPGSLDRDQLNYLEIDGKVSGFSKLRSVNLQVSGTPGYGGTVRWT